jgi:metal-responsive CopG/Arc/MetJ family transcriptional regulator
MATIMGLAVESRSRKAPKLQEVLTRHGCIIKTRLGLHEVAEDNCSQEGIIVLMLSGNAEEIEELKNDIGEIEGVRYNIMTV